MMEEKPVVDEAADPLPGEYGKAIPRELMLRELGFSGRSSRHSAGTKLVSRTLATKAVHTMCTKDLTKRVFQLPVGARTTFHIAFSPDGSKVASCHGDHCVYVCDVASGKLIQTLSGHPRTPWCVVFHPTQNDILASGCLAGQVRVWDLKGGSEVLVTDSGTVVASLTFHPTVRLLAIATYNEIIFWDWGLPYPMARCSTENPREKVRLIRFDRLGKSLITGITNYPTPPYREEPELRTRNEMRFPPLYPHQHRPNILRSGAPSNWNREPYPNEQFPENSMDIPIDIPFPTPGPPSNDQPDPDDNDNDDPNDGPPGSAETVAIAVALASVGDPEAVADDLNDRQERFQESYRQLVNHYQDLVSHYQRFLRNRIPRFLEQNQPIQPPSDPVLIANDPFLPISDSSTDTSPETSNDATPPIDIIVRANPSMESPTTVLEPLLEGTGAEQLPLPIVIDDEVPGPSRLMLGSPLMESLPEEVTSTTLTVPPTDVEMESVPDSTATTVAPAPARPRGSRDIQSIEALAQNILEMQHLCTQARRDAPRTVENQHIEELQNIRRHLEVLQEQTRDLQSSIRQTLSSLARGSFDALRSRIVGEIDADGSSSPPLDDEERRLIAVRDRMMAAAARGIPPRRAPAPVPMETTPIPAITAAPSTTTTETATVSTTPAEPMTYAGVVARSAEPEQAAPPSPAPQPTPSGSTAEPSSSATPRPGNSSSGNNDAVIRITFTPRVTSALNAPELGRVSPPGPYMLSNAPSASRSRVPPVLTMHYDIGEGYYRTRITTNSNSNNRDAAGPSTSGTNNNNNNNNVPSNNEPVPGPSRDPHTFRTDPYRRIFREYHIFGDHRGVPGEAEHSRFCPFSGRDNLMPRVPPRLRFITEMGEEPLLTVWPNAETGQQTATRSFRGLREDDPAAASTDVAVPTTSTAEPNRGLFTTMQGGADRNNNNEPHMNFPMAPAAYGHMMNGGGPQWINNDVGVGVYLTVRNFNDRINSLRADRDFLRVERDQLLRRRASITSALNASASASASASEVHSEDWQRHFNAGLGLVPPNVRQGQRQNSRRRSRNALISEGNLVYTLRHGYARPIPLRPSPWDEFRTNISTSQSGNEVAGSFGSAVNSRLGSNGRELPVTLDGNFRRGYTMRNGEEYTPVYSHLTMTSPTTNSAGLPEEVRDSPQPHVYTFPIGLFLEGSGFLGGIQSMGIFYPPTTREEEESLRDFRRSEELIPLLPPSARPTNGPRYRLEYDQSHLRLVLPHGFSLTFIQPGLTLLDAVTTLSRWSRPRPTSGRVYIQHVAPFLDAVERLFSHRMRRGVLSTAATSSTTPASGPQGAVRLGSTFQVTGPFNRHYTIRARRQVPPPTGPGPAEADDQGAERAEPVQIETVNAEMYSRQLAQRIHRLERMDEWMPPGSPIESAPRYNPARLHFPRPTPNPGPSTSTNHGGEFLAIPTTIERRSGEPFDVYRRRVYHAYVNDMMAERSGYAPDPWGPSTSTAAANGNNHGNADGESSSLASTRRVIRLAVDTATNEVLRNPGPGSSNPPDSVMDYEYPNRSNIARAIESRIERVLNERGNRGMDRGFMYSTSNDLYMARRAAVAAAVNGDQLRPPYNNPRDPRLMRWSAATQTGPSSLFMDSLLAGSNRSEPANLRAGPVIIPAAAGSAPPEEESSPSSENPPPSSATPAATATTPTAAGPATPVTPIPVIPTISIVQGLVTPPTTGTGGTVPTAPSARPLSRRRSYGRMTLTRTGVIMEPNSDDEAVPAQVPRILSRSARGTTTPTSQTTTRAAAAAIPAAAGRRRLSPDITLGAPGAAGPREPAAAGRRRLSPDIALGAPGYAGPRERITERHYRLYNSPNGDQQIIIRRRRGGERYGAHQASVLTNERRATSFASNPAYSSVEMSASSARTRAEASRQVLGGAAGTSGPASTEEGGNSNPQPSTSRSSVRINFNRAYEPRVHPAPSPTINLARARPPTYYTMDASTSAFLSSRIQKWDFSEFFVPDITRRDECIVVRECALHSDACLDVSSDSEFLAVLQPSDNGSYSGVGIYSLRDETLGDTLYIYHFDQNTVSISISPSCDYLVVGYAGRGPLYRFVHPSRNIGQILSLSRDKDRLKLVTVKELFADSANTLMSVNCMHWVPVPGYGIIYGTNTGELILLS